MHFPVQTPDAGPAADRGLLQNQADGRNILNDYDDLKHYNCFKAA